MTNIIDLVLYGGFCFLVIGCISLLVYAIAKGHIDPSKKYPELYPNSWIGLGLLLILILIPEVYKSTDIEKYCSWISFLVMDIYVLIAFLRLIKKLRIKKIK